MVVLDSHTEGARFNSLCVQSFLLRFFGLFYVCMLPPKLCLAFFFLVPSMSACYPQWLTSNCHQLPTNRHRLRTNRHLLHINRHCRAYWTL